MSRSKVKRLAPPQINNQEWLALDAIARQRGAKNWYSYLDGGHWYLCNLCKRAVHGITEHGAGHWKKLSVEDRAVALLLSMETDK